MTQAEKTTAKEQLEKMLASLDRDDANLKARTTELDFFVVKLGASYLVEENVDKKLEDGILFPHLGNATTYAAKHHAASIANRVKNGNGAGSVVLKLSEAIAAELKENEESRAFIIGGLERLDTI